MRTFRHKADRAIAKGIVVLFSLFIFGMLVAGTMGAFVTEPTGGESSEVEFAEGGGRP